MQTFENRSIQLIELKENEEYSNLLKECGIDSKKLLEEIEHGKYNCIYERFSSEQRNKENLMLPILYAIKNEHKTYKIYKYFGEGLKESNKILAKEVVKAEPELIKNTPFSKDPEFILDVAKSNARVILHMSDDMKTNPKVISELQNINSQEVNLYVDIIQRSPELVNNTEFMREVVKEYATVLMYASEELKNNYEFIKEAAKENKEVIDYVAEHTEEFGKEAITGAKEVLTENTTCRAIDEFKSELEKVQEEKARMELQEGFNKDSEEYKKIKIKERQLNNNMAFMDKIRNTEDPSRALKLIDLLCKKIGEDYKQDLIKYFKLEDAVIAKEKEEKSEVKLEDVERVAEKVTRLPKIQEETSEIAKTAKTADRENETIGNEIGE